MKTAGVSLTIGRMLEDGTQREGGKRFSMGSLHEGGEKR